MLPGKITVPKTTTDAKAPNVRRTVKIVENILHLDLDDFEDFEEGPKTRSRSSSSSEDVSAFGKSTLW